MSLDTWLSFALFALVTSITPGPNNFMLLASGVNFGFKLSIPHMSGICVGFFLMVASIGFGLAEVFSRFPIIHTLIKWLGAIYMLYLAWCIATSGPLENAGQTEYHARPITFWEAAAFQWVNPKAWIMAVGAYSTYVPVSSNWIVILCVATLFAVINLPCVGTWALFGSSLRQFLQVRRNLLLFN